MSSGAHVGAPPGAVGTLVNRAYGHPPVFILHGWTYSTDKWQGILGWLYEHGIEPEMLRVPGLTAPSNAVWTIEDYVTWLEEATKQSEPFVLIGHSNGGRIGLNFATRYPDRVKQLILIDSAGVYHDELALRLKRSVFEVAAKVGKRLTSSENLRGTLYKLSRTSDYREAPSHMRHTMANMIESDKDLKLSTISVPTVLIWGHDDKITPLGDGHVMQQAIPGSVLHTVAHARHAPFYTHPEAVGRLIVRALEP